ncbi:hypothetical protein MLD38_018349 [Melastoma candidum]|uniref:Uncharacterized protein n=1 Tax=Melastoma candidum TaxID=119954 RepID=A0ACB9QTH2_9MYRT|nr:hypothetical protein MLD38_018349 [Melastoma candidum]
MSMRDETSLHSDSHRNRKVTKVLQAESAVRALGKKSFLSLFSLPPFHAKQKFVVDRQRQTSSLSRLLGCLSSSTPALPPSPHFSRASSLRPCPAVIGVGLGGRMVEMGRRDVPVRRRARKRRTMMNGGVSGQRKRKFDDTRNQEKARCSSGSRGTSSVDPRSGCREEDDVNGASASCSRERKRKRIGLMRCVKRKAGKITGIVDCGVEDSSTVDKVVIDEAASYAGETLGTQASSCVVRRNRSRTGKSLSGTKKFRAIMPEDLILIDDSDNDEDDGDEDVDNSAVLGDTEDKSNKSGLGLNFSVDEGIEMRHRNIPVAKRTRRQIRMLSDEVFREGRKSKGILHGSTKSSPEIIDVYDDGSEDDSQIIKLAGEVEEKTGDSLGSFARSGIAHRTRSQVADSNEFMSADVEGAKDSEELPLICSNEEVNVVRNKCYLVDEFGNLYPEDEANSTFVEKGGRDETVGRKMSSGKNNKRHREVEDNYEDGEDVITGGADEEDLVDQGSREDEANEADSNEHTSLQFEGDKDSEELPRICSSEEVHVVRNRCYLVDEFGYLYSEDEAISTFVEKREGNETDAGNNSREAWVMIQDYDGEDDYDGDGDDNDEDEEVDDDGGGDGVTDNNEEREEGDDDNREDDLMKYMSEEGGNYEQQLPSYSSENKNGRSMDHTASVLRHRMWDCVARRTRSHFKRMRSDTMKAGTFGNPFCLDSEDDDQKNALTDDSSSGESNKRGVSSASKAGGKSMQKSEGRDEEHWAPADRKPIKNADGAGKIHLTNSARVKGDKLKQKIDGHGQENVTPSKRKHIQRACDARKVLLEAIWSQRDTLRENMNIGTHKVARITNRLFTFGEEDSEPPEKSEAELEMEKLWMEFDFCLRSCELEYGNTDILRTTAMVENGDLQQPKFDDPCLRGVHDAYLDEEIGYRCRHCTFIIQEIRDVVVPFRKDPVERCVKRDNRRGDDDFLRKLPNENKINDLSHGCPSNRDGTVWDLVPGVKSSLYPHQQEGFEFIWKNIAGAVNLSEVRRLKESNEGSGCIISHAPGTGKSRLAIVFLQAYLRFFPDCRPVIIAPKSMLLTWEQEFKKWNVDIPFHNLNNVELSGKEDVEALGILARLNSGSPRQEILRMVKIYSWKCQSSVLGVSYNLFEKLTLGRNTKEDDQSEGKVLLKLPGLLVLDEGHTPRNNDSLIWQALSNVRTQKRICLSGTPFQNNFDELFNTFCMARPGFSSTMSLRNKGDGMRRRGRKPNVVKANWANLTNSICDNNIKELEKLKAMISPFVHVYKGNVLQETLPGLSQRVVYLRPGSLQKKLLQTANLIRNVIERRHLASLISVHPSLLLQHSSPMITGLFPGIREELQGTKLTTQDSAKMKFLIEFLRLADALKEKVLVFSDYLDPLMFLKDQLNSCFGWTEGEEILYMEGKLDVRQRQASISTFNDEDSKVKVLLASTRACCEGISLVGASRVILLDAAWNPAVQRQAISRAYRIGQKRFVYVYYLITHETIEEEVYRQQVNKDRLSNMVFPLDNKGDGFDEHPNSTNEPEDKVLLEMLEHSTIADSIEKVV